MSDQVAVLLKGVSKTFSLNGVRACDRVDLEIRRGETLILMGENGAGKSTLASLITGRILPDGGEIIHREKKGAGMVHQKPQVVENFSVRDMVFGGNVELNRGLFISPGREREELIRIFEETGYDLQPEDLMGDLAPFQHQLTELAENLLMGKRVLILDEPEFPRIPELLAYLKQRGVTPLIITHRVEDALTLGDRIVMMGKGRIIMDRSGGDPGLREALLNNLLHGKSEQSAPTADLTTPSKGFIRVIAGHHESGLWDEEERLAREFLGKGDNGYIPSLNRRKAMEASWTVEENFMIHRRRNFAGPLGLIRKKALLTEGSVSLDRNGVTARPGDRMDHLSGGNQKKLLLLREFQRTGEKILLSEPSAALDRGNRDYLYDLIFKARKQGKEICLLTADPEEAFALGDEVVPLFRGKKGSPLRRGEYTLSRLVELMGGIGT